MYAATYIKDCNEDEELARTLAGVLRLLKPEDGDTKELSDLLEKLHVDEVALEEGHVRPGSGIYVHLLQHESGKPLRENAAGYLEKQKPKMRCATILSEVETLLEEIFTLATTEGPCDKTSLAEKASAIFERIATVNAERNLTKQPLLDSTTLCTPILAKLLDHYCMKVASSYASAVAWVTGEVSAPASWQEHAHMDERLSDRLEAFVGVLDLETFKREELAYEHSMHLVMYACTALRPRPEAPGTTMDTFTSSDATKTKAFFQAYPAQRLREGEELVDGRWGSAAVPHWNGRQDYVDGRWCDPAWKELYKAIEVATLEMSSSRVRQLCEALQVMRGAAAGDAIEQRKSAEQLIGAVKARLQEPFNMVFRTIEKEHAVRRNVEMTKSLTPFSKSGQNRKELGENVRQLKECIEAVGKFGAELDSAPLSMAAFVTTLVADATSLIGEAANESINTEVATLKVSLEQYDALEDKCPHPVEDEKGFQTFMRKSGAKMNDHLKTAEKVFHFYEK